jgi:CheY-like chemotaxis protein
MRVRAAASTLLTKIRLLGAGRRSLLAVRAVVATYLRDAGCAVTEAASGLAGLALLEHRDFDALVVDFAMPDLDGVEVAKRVGELRPGMPLLLITGYRPADRRGGQSRRRGPAQAISPRRACGRAESEGRRRGRIGLEWARGSARR